MAKTVCKAVKQRIVDRRGRPSIEWHKDGVPQYYCYGYADPMTDELLEVCQSCIDHVNHAEEDFEIWHEQFKQIGGQEE